MFERTNDKADVPPVVVAHDVCARTGNTFDLWIRENRCLLVQYYGDEDGWEIWQPVAETNNVQTTLATVQRYLTRPA